MRVVSIVSRVGPRRGHCGSRVKNHGLTVVYGGVVIVVKLVKVVLRFIIVDLRWLIRVILPEMVMATRDNQKILLHAYEHNPYSGVYISLQRGLTV